MTRSSSASDTNRAPAPAAGSPPAPPPGPPSLSPSGPSATASPYPWSTKTSCPKPQYSPKHTHASPPTRAVRHLGYDAPDTRFDGVGDCYVDIGAGPTAKGEGNFLAAPARQVVLHQPGADLHTEKRQQEHDRLTRWNAISRSGRCSEIEADTRAQHIRGR